MPVSWQFTTGVAVVKVKPRASLVGAGITVAVGAGVTALAFAMQSTCDEDTAPSKQLAAGVAVERA